MMMVNYGSSGTYTYKLNKVFYKEAILREFEKKSNIPIFSGITPFARLKKQYIWLKRINEIPELSEHFPSVIDMYEDDLIFRFGMNYLNGDNIMNLYLNRNIDIKFFIKTIEQVSIFVRDKLHTRGVCTINTKDYFYNKHIVKLRDRLNFIRNEYKYIDEFNIINDKAIYINGKKFLNFNEIDRIIKDDHLLQSLLSPKHISMVHGDLHLQNIFLDQKNKFYLLDPRGTDSSPMYDISKLSHNTLGLYHAILNGNFSLKIVGKNRLNLKIRLSEYQKKKYLTIQQALNLIYKKVWMGTYDNPSRFVLQVLAFNASHCIGAAPFLTLNQDKNKKLQKFWAMYLVGIYLFHKLLDVPRNIKEIEEIDFSDAPFFIAM